MMPLDLYLSYLVAALIVIAAPGPDSLNSLAIGISRGRREGVAYALGVGVGCLTHTVWAMLGISAIVAASATLFNVIKWIGVAYLVWLGIQSLRSRGSMAAMSAAAGPLPETSPSASSQGPARSTSASPCSRNSERQEKPALSKSPGRSSNSAPSSAANEGCGISLIMACSVRAI